MNKLVKIGGVGLVLLALAALIGSTMTFAQTDDPDTAIPDAGQTEQTEEAAPDAGEPWWGGPLGHGRGGMMGHRLFDREAMDAALADELGITVEELEAARQTAKETVLNQLVADGTLTQAQADAILAGEGLRSLGPLLTQDEMEAVMAEALGMTVEELQAALATGQRLPELAAEAGVALEDVHAAVQAAREAAILQAVEEGLITQDQADWLLERGNNPGFGGPRGGHGFGGHHGGPGGFGPGNGFNNGTNDTPASGLNG